MTAFPPSARSAEREHEQNQCTRDRRGLTIGRVITRGDYELAGARFIAPESAAFRSRICQMAHLVGRGTSGTACCARLYSHTSPAGNHRGRFASGLFLFFASRNAV